MVAYISMFRLSFIIRETTNTYAISKPLLDFQKRRLWHGFSSELNMDARNGRGIDRQRAKQAAQTWRAVSTQPDCSKVSADGEWALPKHREEDVRRIADLDGPVVPDASLDQNITPPKKHSVSMLIGTPVMRFIKGKWGTAYKKIERETGVTIIFPLSKDDESIILQGNSAESITKASEKIQTIIDQAANSRNLDYSHFVCLPLAIYPELLDKLVGFQNTILGPMADDKEKIMDNDMCGDTLDEENHSTASKDSLELKVEKADPNVEINKNSDQHPETHVVPEVKAVGADTQRIRVKTANNTLVSYAPKAPKAPSMEATSSESTDRIDRSIFIKPQTLHLTVIMLKLWNTERVKAAAEVLQRVSSKVMEALENRPVSIRLKGLECMRGTKEKAFVIYSPVEEIGAEGRLLRACQVITDAMAEAGLVVGNDAEKPLTLHATLMNARHRKRKPRTKNVQPFDASDIFEKYGSEEWGEYALTEAHLSQRYLYDENGFYHCCTSIPLPQNKQVD